jgi:hypothetical protein
VVFSKKTPHDDAGGRMMSLWGGEQGVIMTNDVKTTETPQVAEPGPSSKPKQFTKLGEDIGETTPLQPLPAFASPLAEDSSRAGQFRRVGIAAKFGQPTWLVGTTLSLALVTLLAFSLLAARNRGLRKTAERKIETVTPEMVMGGCGQAAEDVTKDLYPIIMRSMTYKSGGKTVVLEFSRTAEENSQWVFLSMKDETGKIKYETPEAQIDALSCLTSTKWK